MTRGHRRTVFRSAILSIILLALAGTAAGRALNPRVDLDHRAVRAHDTAVVYVLMDFDPVDTPVDPDAPRPRLNLALVLDRSGSMDERGKMAYAREAASMMVDLLHPEDRLAVIDYDDKVNVLWPSSFVDAPEQVKRRIAGLDPRGSTDLFGGLSRGVEEILPHRDGADITRVVLLSDGLANRGVTDVREIVRRVRGFAGRGVSVTTMGLGLDYNEDLMEAVAGAAGGNYAFIENPRTMAGIFAEELHTLATTVARDVEVVYEPSRRVNDVEIYGYEVREGRGVYRVPMENVFGGETRSLLLRLEVETGRPGSLDLGELVVSYHDQIDDRPVDEVLPLNVRVTDDLQEIDASCNNRVLVEANLIEADRKLDRVARLMDSGDAAGAEVALSSIAGDLSSVNSRAPDPRLEAKLEALAMEREDMLNSAGDADASRSFVKQMKANNRQGTKGKQQYLLLAPGDQGAEVRRLQEALRKEGLYTGPPDGVYDDDVEEALRTYQSQEGLKADGVAGPRTLRALGLY